MVVELPGIPALRLVPAREDEFEALHALRLRAMRPSLEAVGRYDEARARERLAAGYSPDHTRHIQAAVAADGGFERVGFVVLKALSRTMRLDHLYVEPAFQGRGIGRRVMGWICAQADAAQQPVELCALKGSDANRFYPRFGFVPAGEGEWDLDWLRAPVGPRLRCVIGLWQAIEARDWAAVEGALHPTLKARWWTSGEQFDSAAAFVAVQRAYPEGWAVRVLEAAELDDGRVMTVVRVTHPPQTFYATSVFRLENGRIAELDEYWATVEAPPAWRTALAPAGLRPLDWAADPRERP